MKWYKIKAMAYRDFLIYRKLRFSAFQLVYFPITMLLIWGLFSLAFRSSAFEASIVVLVVNIFWNFAQLSQSSVNTNMMRDTWAGELKQLMLSGMSEFEYLFARILSSTVMTGIIVTLLLSASYYLFNITLIATHSATIASLIIITLLASYGMSTFIAAMILQFGRDYDFLAWTALQAFVVLSAPFYPVTIFPEPLRSISWLMPFTHIFEAVRSLIFTNAINPALLTNGLIIAISYIALSIPLYYYIFRRAKKNGRIIRFS